MKLRITIEYTVSKQVALEMVPRGSGGCYGPRQVSMDDVPHAALIALEDQEVRGCIIAREELPEESKDRRDAEHFDNEFA